MFPVLATITKAEDYRRQLTESLSGGAIKVRLFPSGTLGQEREVVQQLQEGLVDFMVSGTVASFAGLLAVWNTHFVSPSSAELHRSVLLIVMVILGGLGTTMGPIVGAAIVVLVENVVSNSIELGRFWYGR